jgi:hypothetical protein
MCSHHGPASTNAEFAAFCSAVHRWLAASPLLDPPLAAAAELLERQAASDGLGWFECEVAHVAWKSEDMHSALGAGVLLSLWNATRSGDFSLP